MRDIRLLSTVKLADGNYTVVETWDALVKLRDNQTGAYRVLDVYEMSTRLLEPPGRPAQGVRDFQLEDRKYGREIARLAGHLNEMISGVPRSGESANPKYDLDKTTPGERFNTKLNELHALGIPCAPRTLHRWVVSYKTSGASGLVDRRGRRKSDLFAGWDARIVVVLRRVMEDETDESTGTIGRLEDRFKERLFRDSRQNPFTFPLEPHFGSGSNSSTTASTPSATPRIGGRKQSSPRA